MSDEMLPTDVQEITNNLSLFPLGINTTLYKYSKFPAIYI